MRTSDPLTLWRNLEAEGFTLTTKGGRLRVAPADRLTDEHRAAIRQHREGLLALAENNPLGAAQQVEIYQLTPLARDDSTGLSVAAMAACRVCRGVRFWTVPGGRWVCATCHPPAPSLSGIQWTEAAPPEPVTCCARCANFQHGEPNPAESLGRCGVTLSGLPPPGGTGYRAPSPGARRTCPKFTERGDKA
ncbi:hypothetical protein HHS34_010505 [Acidithiobacillus montserratensis]|uniref:Uncharacterized protein n=1 Tax=Acidithiobacillus montserratensis TaxID=2729135 RepID=A0ACD5HG24_9PROT|nr:hypothetical protein [Acidithiobacillus montserratensis]MBU2748841.1 hypothetical protein [Acidithiobacillus montserratensis]